MLTLEMMTMVSMITSVMSEYDLYVNWGICIIVIAYVWYRIGWKDKR